MDGMLRIIMNRSVVMMNVPKFVQLLLQEYFISSVCSNDNDDSDNDNNEKMICSQLL